jgi:CheY-like chemotaxis protein
MARTAEPSRLSGVARGFPQCPKGRCGFRVALAQRAKMSVILIVEDEPMVRMAAEMLLQDWGHETLSASDVEEALSILRSPEPIDALFTDIRLGAAVLGGCDLARQAIALRPRLRVLYTSGSCLTEKMREPFVVGAHFLAKPYTQQQLQHSIQAMSAA